MRRLGATEPDPSQRVARRRPSSAITARPLPAGLVEGSVARLQWIALGMAVTVLGVYWIGRNAGSGWIRADQAPDSYSVASFGAAAAGAAMFALAYSRRLSAYLVLDIGLVFQVMVGLLISLAENAVPRLPGEIIRGHSSVAVWIAFFVLAVPASFSKTALAAGTTACMGPAGLGAQVLLGNVPKPDAAVWLFPFASSFLMAGGAAMLARFMYDLGRQAGEAQEMGSYQLVERLDQGGMGEVWRARHRMLAREAAIKLIRAEALEGSQAAAAIRRFEREARATAELRSPHTVTLYDYGVSQDGRFYYVMELLDGINLEELVARHGPLPAARAVHVLRQACDSLGEAHARGLIHRDVKPGNLLLCRLGNTCDFVKVLDFGLVKHTRGEHTQLTAAGTAAGTPAFLAPEVAEGRVELDARADLYSLGCVAYWLLTGRLVFEESNALSMALAHLRAEVLPPSQATDNEIPPELERVVLACLEKSPGRRPPSAAVLAERLAASLPGPGWDGRQAEQWWRTHAPQKPLT